MLGARAVTRRPSNLLPHTTGPPASGAARSIHIPSYLRAHPKFPTPDQAQRIFTHSRNLLAQFFTYLTNPGLRVRNAAQGARSIYQARMPSIQQGFSFPTRVVLSRPIQASFLPRPPAIPRSVAQVGLGTARSFSTARPIFQNLVENVPVAGRAFYEADWEIKMRKEPEAKKPMKYNSQAKQATKEMLKPRNRRAPFAEENVQKEEAPIEIQMDEYFPASSITDVMTCLLIPLAPTPTTRTPLSDDHTPDMLLLPISKLASMHVSHETHSLRVSSLFSRLDAANIWARGAQCSAFSHGGADGVCTMLKVEFTGWTKAEVRAVIGESGSGWCILEEYALNARQSQLQYYASDDDDRDDDTLSDASSLFSHSFEDFGTDEKIDPAQSLRIPTLDFTACFESPTTPTAPTPAQPLFSTAGFYPIGQSESEFDPWLDSEVSSECGLSDRSSDWVYAGQPMSVDSHFGFSSQFA